MKKLILTTAILMCSFLKAQTINLEVNMSGFKSNTGNVKVGLYDSKGTFLKSTLVSLSSEIKDKQAKVVFKGLKKGEYAVSIYHDENNNGVMDKNMMGIPKEDYASSNNAKGLMGPPKYEDAKFIVNNDLKIKIKLNE